MSEESEEKNRGTETKDNRKRKAKEGGERDKCGDEWS